MVRSGEIDSIKICGLSNGSILWPRGSFDIFEIPKKLK